MARVRADAWYLSHGSSIYVLVLACSGSCLRDLGGTQGLPCDIQGCIKTGFGDGVLAGKGSQLLDREQMISPRRPELGPGDSELPRHSVGSWALCSGQSQ